MTGQTASPQSDLILPAYQLVRTERLTATRSACAALIHCGYNLWNWKGKGCSLQKPLSMWGSIYGSLHTTLTSRSQRNVERGGHASIELDEQPTSATGVGEAGNLEKHMHDEGLWDAMHPRSDGKSAPLESLKRLWSTNLNLILAYSSYGPLGGNPRDYLALEQTFNGCFRTSSPLVSFGVFITQLLRCRSRKGKIHGAILAVGGVASSPLGCMRNFRQQHLLIRSKTHSGACHTTVTLASLSTITSSLSIIVHVAG